MKIKYFFGGIFLLFGILFLCNWNMISKKDTGVLKTTQESKKRDISKEKKELTRPLRIELDPGHGGEDNGASANGSKEKNINLKIANYLKRELERYDNVQVFLTRKGDDKVDLEARVEKAINDKVDVMISLHNNAKGVNPEYDHGCMVITGTGNFHSKLARQEQKLGSFILEYLSELGIKNQGLLVRTSQTDSRYPDGSLCDYYSVIRNCTRYNLPGIIVEHAFMDHSGDYNTFLSSDRKLEQIAQKEAKAILLYYGLNEKNTKSVKVIEKITWVKDENPRNNHYSNRSFTVTK